MMNRTSSILLLLVANAAVAGTPMTSALLNPSAPNAMSTPEWGFLALRTDPVALVPSRSLIFDQHFDGGSFRPIPTAQPVVAKNAGERKAAAHPTDSDHASAIPAKPVVANVPASTVAHVANAPSTASASLASAAAAAVTSPSVAPQASKANQPSNPNVASSSTPSKQPTPAPAKPQPVTVASRPAQRPRPPLHFLRTAREGVAGVLVLDDESVSLKNPQPVPGALVHWLSPQSGLFRKAGVSGFSKSPYPHTVSARFFVTAPGYLPAVGYATIGHVTPIVLIKESRIGPVLKSLDLAPDPARPVVFGKVVRGDLTPVGDLTIDANLEAPHKVYYSIGSFGLFHAGANHTGPQGDFLISGVRRGFQYLMPAEKGREWPAWILDATDLPPVVTVTLMDAKPSTVQTQIVDAMALETPSSEVNVTLGGQRGLYQPDERGFVSIKDVYARGSTDLLEIQAAGYRKTWLNSTAEESLFPAMVSLFTNAQLSSMFEERGALATLDPTASVVFGNLRPDEFTRAVNVQVFDSVGHRQRDAKVLYFDSENRVDSQRQHTDAATQNFAIIGLPNGEWHLVLTDSVTGRGVGLQSVRVEAGTVSQVQF